MKIVTLIVSMLLVGGVRAGDSGDNLPVTEYSDTCDYTQYFSKCGDQCLHLAALCECGSSEPFQPWGTDQHCCIPSGGNCIREPGEYGDDGVCSEGRSLPMSSHCNNTDRSLQCYNSYQDSQYIGALSHYTCQHTCVSVHEDMCRGVNWCGKDYEACGPQLRCSYDTLRLNLSSSLAPGHHYCVLPAVGGDGEHFRQGEYMVKNVIKTQLI